MDFLGFRSNSPDSLKLISTAWAQSSFPRSHWNGAFDMNGKILALLFTIGLTSTAGAANVNVTNKINASAEGLLMVAYNAPRAAAADSFPEKPTALSAAALDIAREERRSPLNRAVAPVLSLMQKVTAFFEPRNFAESCMARAVYFEARSESRQGQLAVATVILNRTKSSHYPSSICGVVYQGASRHNSCQFSFACDGKPDFPDHASAWKAALEVTALALGDKTITDDSELRIVSTATHYHADYVRPRWSRSLNRLTKIGRHIFYSQG
jgi:Cell Wall Hydrolase